jgi:hypothetical protein
MDNLTLMSKISKWRLYSSSDGKDHTMDNAWYMRRTFTPPHQNRPQIQTGSMSILCLIYIIVILFSVVQWLVQRGGERGFRWRDSRWGGGDWVAGLPRGVRICSPEPVVRGVITYKWRPLFAVEKIENLYERTLEVTGPVTGEGWQ